MTCPYENRCKNSDKCYRCFNESLLKLPEDKTRKKHKKTAVYNQKVAQSEDSWKDLEQSVADQLNMVPTMQEARRSRASGALWFEKGDVVDTILHPECKERTGRTLKSGVRSMSIQREWLEKAKEEIHHSNKIMCLPFRFKEDTNTYVIFDFNDIAELIQNAKAYLADNDVKEKEIALLKKEIDKLSQQLKDSKKS